MALGDVSFWSSKSCEYGKLSKKVLARFDDGGK